MEQGKGGGGSGTHVKCPLGQFSENSYIMLINLLKVLAKTPTWPKGRTGLNSLCFRQLWILLLEKKVLMDNYRPLL